mmetsp:Transcript_8571/g.14483  ORF Transcript_8571/g.14483 Transcript_8571/m.14483 type:complete len:291 (-) Transcript_8571:562-1434(-)
MFPFIGHSCFLAGLLLPFRRRRCSYRGPEEQRGELLVVVVGRPKVRGPRDEQQPHAHDVDVAEEIVEVGAHGDRVDPAHRRHGHPPKPGHQGRRQRQQVRFDPFQRVAARVHGRVLLVGACHVAFQPRPRRLDVRFGPHGGHVVEEAQTRSQARLVQGRGFRRQEVAGDPGPHRGVHFFRVLLERQRRGVARVGFRSGLQHRLGFWELVAALEQSHVRLDELEKFGRRERAAVDSLRLQVNPKHPAHVSVQELAELRLEPLPARDLPVVGLAGHRQARVREHEARDVLEA